MPEGPSGACRQFMLPLQRTTQTTVGAAVKEWLASLQSPASRRMEEHSNNAAQARAEQRARNRARGVDPERQEHATPSGQPPRLPESNVHARTPSAARLGLPCSMSAFLQVKQPLLTCCWSLLNMTCAGCNAYHASDKGVLC